MSLEATIEELALTLKNNSEHWKPRMKALDALLDIAGKQLNTPDNLTKEIFHKLKLPLKKE